MAAIEGKAVVQVRLSDMDYGRDWPSLASRMGRGRLVERTGWFSRGESASVGNETRPLQIEQ